MNRSSGNVDLDSAALEAIFKTFPVDPLPDDFEKKDLAVILNFSDYNPKNCKDNQKMKENPDHEQQ